MRERSPSLLLRLELLDADLVPVYRAMTPAQRVAAGLSATDMIRDRLRATVQEAHPKWSDEAVSRRMLDARVGSIATMSYGEPRATLDVDLVIALDGSQLATV